MKRETYITNSAEQTKKIGGKIAKEVLKLGPKKTAIILGLSGNLGAGKTTFLQGFAKGLKIKEKILSPTFVIQKRFLLKNKKFGNFYHIDCYRLKSSKDILDLDFKKTIGDPENIVAIEWPEKIKKILPQNITAINFKFIDEKIRNVIINYGKAIDNY